MNVTLKEHYVTIWIWQNIASVQKNLRILMFYKSYEAEYLIQ